MKNEDVDMEGSSGKNLYQIFDGFFHINVGHVAIVAVFLFGVGVSWSKYDSRIDRAESSVNASKETAQVATSALATTVETRTKGIESRVTRLEDQQVAVTALATNVAVLATEVKNLQEVVRDLKDELRQDRTAGGAGKRAEP